ncbi:MAG: SAM-dependent chlorinase/fluorinase [Vicinamibacterales bacterium]
MPRPVIALLTDFGLRDHYVAAMKGVMLGICPDATFLDITHEIAPQDVLEGALELEAVAPYLPPETVVVGVVDPGVGSRRRGVAIEARGLRFVGPDNGLFTLAVGPQTPQIAVEITNGAFTLDSISRTFEGRDRFAPAAARLARGANIGECGPVAPDLVQLTMPRAVVTPERLDGVVLRQDRFGNLITNIRRDDLSVVGLSVTVRVAGTTIASLSATYADVPQGALCALIGSTDRLEIAVNGGSAALSHGVARGAAVQVLRRSGA